ncbi:hypothetical protein L6261_03720 [Candidatus Parcubacteria bacterium]|nr:hypothetical protein [Candidatus Parcubacteria bacterium]
MKKGLSLIGLLIIVGIMAFIFFRSFYNSNPEDQAVEDGGGVKKIINQVENITGKLDEGNKEILNTVNEI